jgi:hypothetical protein
MALDLYRTLRVCQSPLGKLAVYLLLELWLVLHIPESVLRDSDFARSYVEVMSTVAPVIHHLDRIAAQPEVLSFFLSISPVLLIPKIVFVVQWLKSDRLRIYRYFVISPLTRAVPKGPFDFVTDPLRTEKENDSPERVRPISVLRRVVLSLVMLCFVALGGIIWPWVLYGWDIAKGGGVSDFREIAVAQGGWRLWLSWSVYQMTFAAGFLAIGYCILVEYVRWVKKLFSRALGYPTSRSDGR